MALFIQTNVASLNAQTNLANTQVSLQSSFARLSSGYRINSAADDAARMPSPNAMRTTVSACRKPRTVLQDKSRECFNACVNCRSNR
jgi:flagellin-like hook-associated protein FlgL